VSVRFGLTYFGKAFGRYPYRTLTVVHPPEGAEEAGGMEYPTLITTGGPWPMPWTGVRYLETVTLHELGHQWFYGLVATDEHCWPFLDEGVNSYAEADVLAARYGRSSAVDGFGLAIDMDAVNRAASADVERNAPVAQPSYAFRSGGDYGSLVYRRTAAIFATLGNVYGADQVRRAVGRYARRHRFQHPGPEDLLGALAEVLGPDAAEAARIALFEEGTVDYAIEGLYSSTAAPQGVFGDPPVAPSKPAPEAPAEWTGSALARRRGKLRFPVDIALVGEDGTTQRVRWDAQAESERIPYRGKSRLVAAVIDPDHRILLDDDLLNNARRRGSRVLSRRALERFTFGAEAALLGLLP
jgi:aminopeptidase N